MKTKAQSKLIVLDSPGFVSLRTFITALSTPHDAQKLEHAGPSDSPGLDDFAHMGLINDLLLE